MLGQVIGYLMPTGLGVGKKVCLRPADDIAFQPSQGYTQYVGMIFIGAYQRRATGAAEVAGDVIRRGVAGKIVSTAQPTELLALERGTSAKSRAMPAPTFAAMTIVYWPQTAADAVLHRFTETLPTYIAHRFLLGIRRI
tara:strand:- start:2916 stop:3332 length:417 start_codon:yes stop_codon:yes gene_type:complete